MSHVEASLLGAVSGLTIFIGLPVARLRHFPAGFRNTMPAIATGVLIFLLWDVLSHAGEVVTGAMPNGSHGSLPRFVGLLAAFLVGLTVGLLGLVYTSGRMMGRVRGSSESPRQLAMIIAGGLGMHNLSEGLAIGQAAGTGALALTGVLVVGFGLHNITEGFGIGAPLAVDKTVPSWGFLAGAGLLGGGPTFVGATVGYMIISPYFYVLFLTLAAGAIIYVINEMFPLGKRLSTRAPMAWALLSGFVGAYATDLLLTYIGA